MNHIRPDLGNDALHTVVPQANAEPGFKENLVEKNCIFDLWRGSLRVVPRRLLLLDCIREQLRTSFN